MTKHDDDDLRAAFETAHEPAPAFARVLATTPRRWRVRPLAVATLATVVTIAAVGIVWPRREPVAPPAPETALAFDPSAPELRSTSLVTPLDSLLHVPGLDALGTTPELGRVPALGLPSVPGGMP